MSETPKGTSTPWNLESSTITGYDRSPVKHKEPGLLPLRTTPALRSLESWAPNQTASFTKTTFTWVPAHKSGRRLLGRQRTANFKRNTEVLNVKGCINHVCSPKRRLQAVAEVLPKPNRFLTVRWKRAEKQNCTTRPSANTRLQQHTCSAKILRQHRGGWAQASR